MRPKSLAAFVLCCCLGAGFAAAANRSASLSQPLVDWGSANVTAQHAEFTALPKNAGVEVRTFANDKSERRPGVIVAAPRDGWDLDTWEAIGVELENPQDSPLVVRCQVANAKPADADKNANTFEIELAPHEKRELRGVLVRKTPAAPGEKLVGFLKDYPGKDDKPTLGLLASRVATVRLYVPAPSAERKFFVRRIAAVGRYMPPALWDKNRMEFFPFVDSFGQYVHEDWPGKVYRVEDLVRQRQVEEAALAAQAAPQGRSKYGGWAQGPRLKATGFFRVEKYAGRWWMVDPEGCLFWSYGVNCVRMSEVTIVAHRERYFQWLPGPSDPLAQFYDSTAATATGPSPSKERATFDFIRANGYRKYGPQFASIFPDVAVRRLTSWGFNTIGNWSDESVLGLRRLPYVGTIRYNHAAVRRVAGYVHPKGKIMDPFDPSFRREVALRLAQEKGKSAGDPWCLGYFVDNELPWGAEEFGSAMGTLRSPADQPAKRQFIGDLKAKYGDIARLNAAWGTAHASWDAMLQSTQTPEEKVPAVAADLGAFVDRLADEYFTTIRDELRKVAPNQLYMGGRFAAYNARLMRAAARTCDVVSINRYQWTVRDLGIEGMDRPILVSEFQFGACDRGMLDGGSRTTPCQASRCRAYREYLYGALANPAIVGMHYFQYADQPLTGRKDGESGQFGLINVCDQPYAELLVVVREIAVDMYSVRAAKEK